MIAGIVRRGRCRLPDRVGTEFQNPGVLGFCLWLEGPPGTGDKTPIPRVLEFCPCPGAAPRHETEIQNPLGFWFLSNGQGRPCARLVAAGRCGAWFGKNLNRSPGAA